ncbi:nucleolar protein 12 domain-containing protein [Trichoderma austrokoningii]
MFAKPRPKKSPLPPPSKKRKYGVEQVSFDFDARNEYLTGFHKRKQQRIKQAQEEAAKKAREERIRTRKQLRDERMKEVEEHVEHVNKLLRESGAIEDDTTEQSEEDSKEGEWDGFPDRPNLDIVDHEEEYIDEDRYTTVTVESVSISRDGLERPEKPKEKAEEDQDGEADKVDQDDKSAKKGPARPKKKRPKFRYESKIERQLAGRKQKAKKSAKASERKSR